MRPPVCGAGFSPSHPANRVPFIILITSRAGQMNRTFGAWGYVVPVYGSMPHAGIKRAAGLKFAII
jgi:hypothetical protein